MIAAWAIFRGSLPLQLIALALAGWAALGADELYRFSMGKAEGRSEIATAVKEKSDADTKLSQDVRGDVASGKPGKPDPHRLRPVPSATGKDRSSH